MSFLSPQQLADRLGAEARDPRRLAGEGPRPSPPQAGPHAQGPGPLPLNDIEAWEQANQHEHTAGLTN